MLKTLSLMMAGSFVCCSSLLATNDLETIINTSFKITNSSSTATCTLISRTVNGEPPETILLTAAHVLEKATGDKARIIKREKRADGDYVRSELAVKIRDGDQPLWVKHPKLDIAAMRVDLGDDPTFKTIPYEQIANESIIGTPASDESTPEESRSGESIELGDEVWILCYPAQLESSDAGFPVLRRGTVASFPITPIKHFNTMLVDFSTFGGDSGGPVFIRRKDKPCLVVGLVLAQHRETTKSVTPIEERIVHRSMGLSIIVHAAFIRETIDRL